MSDNNELGILARRKIEAEIIKPIYEILVREIGKARAQAVIGEAIEQAAIDAGKAFASKEPNGADIQSFIALQYLWEKDNALDVKVIDADDQQYNYNVNRCRYAEMYHEMGLGEIGHLLSCARDEKFIVGYAPDVELTRTTTIMQGGVLLRLPLSRAEGQAMIRVNAERLWSTLNDDGADRRHAGRRRHPLALSDEDRRRATCCASGRWSRFSLRVDSMGNMFIRRAGKNPQLAPV
jgi:hypothetical protein